MTHEDTTDATPFQTGKAYLIRTVTNYWTGRVVAINLCSPGWLVLEDAAWICETGRYAQATSAEALQEVEPRDGQVIVGLSAIVDAAEWLSPLPREVK